MKLALRLVALVFVVPATFYFVYWLPLSLIPLGESRWIATSISLSCALVAGWFVWVKLASVRHGGLSSTILGAILVGGLGFTAGFFGPIVFAPEANQGPLLGIFITGPLGFVMGGIAGFLHWVLRGRKAAVNA